MISSLEEYKSKLDDFLCENNEKEKWILRGQADPDWNLKTRLGRDHPTISSEKHAEQVHRFRSEIKAPKGKQPYDKPVLQLGQHYGLKTNLLDWTTNPIIALFFPLADKVFRDKFAIFALRVTRELVDRKQEDILDDDDCPISIYDPLNILEWNTFKYPHDEVLLASNRNIKQQQGLFTYRNIINFDLAPYFKNGGDRSRFRWISDTASHKILDSIRVECPELFESEYFLRNASERANKELDASSGCIRQ